MSQVPVRAAPRPLIALLSEAVLAMIEPLDPPRRGGGVERPEPAGRYAGFDAPTYQRRGLRIAGLEPDA